MTECLRAAAIAAAGILGVAGTTISATAGIIVIDDFSSVAAPNPWPVMLNSEGNVTVNESGLGVLGGTRQTYIEATAVGIPGLDFLQVTVAAGAGLLDFNSTVDTDGYLSMLYDGGGSLNADFSTMNAIEFSFALFDHAGGQALPVTVHLSDGTNTASHTIALNAPGAQQLIFSFGDFAGIGLIDLSSLQSIQFDLDPAVGADFRISQVIAVPGPAGIALLGIGLAAPRRRRD
jgi:hypothetical protein